MAGERKTVSFYGSAPARSGLTLVSKRIGTPFRIVSIRATFPSGCINLLALRFYTAFDLHTGTTTEPNGVSVLRDYGQVDYLVGEGEQKLIEHSVAVAERGSYLKVWGVNDDFFDHAIDVQMTIDIGEESEGC